MKPRDFIAGDKGLVPIDSIHYVDTRHLIDDGYIDVAHKAGVERVSGFFAIEAVMLLKPGALEGKRMRWAKRVWFVHNVIAHPAMQFLALAADLVKPVSENWSNKLYRTAMHLHDNTVPKPTGFRAPAP